MTRLAGDPSSLRWFYGEFENAIGSSGADRIVGNNLNNVISGGGSDDTLDGGSGIDTAVLSANRSNYAITKTNTSFTVKDNVGNDGTDLLTNVERLQFLDDKVAIDMGATQSGGEAALLIGAVLGKASLTNKATVGGLLQFFDGGHTMHDAAVVLVNERIMDQLAGGSSTSAYVNLIYEAVVGQAPMPSATESLAAYIDTGGYTKADFLAVVANLPLNESNVGLVGLAQAGIEYS
jgi:hypothetical protein